MFDGVTDFGNSSSFHQVRHRWINAFKEIFLMF